MPRNPANSYRSDDYARIARDDRLVGDKIRMATTMAAKDHMSSADFTYRHNIDGTTDSICLRCFLTAATGIRTDEYFDALGGRAHPPVLALRARMA